MQALPVFDCGALFAALDTRRRDRGPGWYELADELRTARLADMDLAMRTTQRLGRPAAAFIHAARW
jgi:hypothetical protein